MRHTDRASAPRVRQTPASKIKITEAPGVDLKGKPIKNKKNATGAGGCGGSGGGEEGSTKSNISRKLCVTTPSQLIAHTFYFVVTESIMYLQSQGQGHLVIY